MPMLYVSRNGSITVRLANVPGDINHWTVNKERLLSWNDVKKPGRYVHVSRDSLLVAHYYPKLCEIEKLTLLFSPLKPYIVIFIIWSL